MSEQDIFTEDELIMALRVASREPEEDSAAHTMRDLIAMTGMGKARLRERLRKLIESGDVECVRRPVTRIDKVRATVPAYRLLRRDDSERKAN